MPSVTFLGTGPGTGLAGRFQSSILLQADGASVLLDAGEPCTAQLLNLGVNLTELDAVLLTHAHADHTAGLPLLLQASKDRGRTAALPLGLPAHLAAPLDAWLRAVLLPPDRLSYPLEMFAWADGIAQPCAGLLVTPHHTTHLAATAQKLLDPSLEAFLFEIVAEGRRIIYSGDLGAAADLRPHLDRPVDLLICELAHFAPEDLLAVLQPAKIGVLCLTHLSSEADERRSEIKLLLEESLDQTDALYLPTDGEEIDF